MIRGTTPTIPLYVNRDISAWKMYVTLESACSEITVSNDRLDVEYIPAHDDEPERTNVTFTLTQEETLSLGVGAVEIQIRAIHDGTAVATGIARTENGRVLLDGVIDE